MNTENNNNPVANTNPNTLIIGQGNFADQVSLYKDPVRRLVACTQYRENYGAHSWDGVGSCPQYWKNKGGSEYTIARLTLSDIAALGPDGLEALVRENFEGVNDDFSQEWVINWALYEDGEETPDEKMYRQMADEDYPNHYTPYPIN